MIRHTVVVQDAAGGLHTQGRPANQSLDFGSPSVWTSQFFFRSCHQYFQQANRLSHCRKAYSAVAFAGRAWIDNLGKALAAALGVQDS